MKSIIRPLVGLSVPVVALFVSLFAAAPAHAHHPMGGAPVTTAFEGFMSGIAHPVIGVDQFVGAFPHGNAFAALSPPTCTRGNLSSAQIPSAPWRKSMPAPMAVRNLSPTSWPPGRK